MARTAYGVSGSAALGTAVASSATANTWGSWVEFVASTSTDIDGFTVGWYNRTTAKRMAFQVGTGAAASEVAIFDSVISDNYTRADGMIFVPLAIASGTRISLRVQNTGSGSFDINAELVTTGTGENNTTATQSEAWGYVSGSTDSLSLPHSSAGENSYAELTSSCGFAVKFIQVVMANGYDSSMANATWGVDISTGAASSEVIEVGDIQFYTDSVKDGIHGFCSQLYPVDIPASTRVAARVHVSETTNTPHCVVLAYDETAAGGADETVSVNNADIVYGPQGVNVFLSSKIPVSNADIIYSGRDIDVEVSSILQITNAGIVYSGQSIDLTAASNIPIDNANITYSGRTVDVFFSELFLIDNATITYSGINIGLILNDLIAVNNGIIIYTPQAVNISFGENLPVDKAAITYSGQSIGLTLDEFIGVSNADITYSGQGVNAYVAQNFPVEAGSIVYNPQSLDAVLGTRVSIENGDITYSGQALLVSNHDFVSMDNADIIYTGQNILPVDSGVDPIDAATIVYSGVPIIVVGALDEDGAYSYLKRRRRI